MDKAQSKFFNTALKMNDALFQLLENYDFNDITISQICQKAGVNRSTFYAHYDNTFDLLEETHQNFVSQFFSIYELKESEIENLDKQNSVFITSKYLLPYLEFIKKNKKLFKLYFNNLQTFMPDEVFNQLINKVFIPVLKKHNVTDKTVIEYMAQYYLMGITAITIKWLDRDCADDVHFVCEVITTCVRPYLPE